MDQHLFVDANKFLYLHGKGVPPKDAMSFTSRYFKSKGGPPKDAKSITSRYFPIPPEKVRGIMQEYLNEIDWYLGLEEEFNCSGMC